MKHSAQLGYRFLVNRQSNVLEAMKNGQSKIFLRDVCVGLLRTRRGFMVVRYSGH